MSFACTHIDLAVQAACCDRLGDIFTDAKGASFCGTSSHEEFLSCAGVESKCNVVVEKRQGEFCYPRQSDAATDPSRRLGHFGHWRRCLCRQVWRCPGLFGHQVGRLERSFARRFGH